MSYSVIVPSNVTSKLLKCVRQLLQHTPSLEPSKIIVVDDGARKGVDPLDATLQAMTWVEGIKPFIYARNVNLGIRAAGRDDVVIIGDDVKAFTSLDLLAETAKRPGAGAVSGAIIGDVGNLHQSRKTQRSVRESPKELCFVCVYIPRAVLDAVGELDERFIYYGCEDVDWSWRAQSMGYRLLVDDRCVVVHNDPDMPSAYRGQKDIAEKGQKALALLKAKWPERFQN